MIEYATLKSVISRGYGLVEGEEEGRRREGRGGGGSFRRFEVRRDVEGCNNLSAKGVVKEKYPSWGRFGYGVDLPV